MIYDTFLFYNELDLLELRLNELYDVVDKFVIVEGEYSCQGSRKPLYYWENKERFSQFQDKIIHINATAETVSLNTWGHEFNQRDAIMKCLNCNDGDYIILGDADEIFSRNTCQHIKDLKVVSRMYVHLKFHYYYINCVNPSHFTVPVIPFRDCKLIMPSVFRRQGNQIGNPNIVNGGWHFSYLGGVKAIVHKLETFAHSEYNTSYWKNEERIRKMMDKGEDLFERGQKFTFVKIDSSYPKYVIENMEKYRNLGFIKE